MRRDRSDMTPGAAREFAYAEKMRWVLAAILLVLIIFGLSLQSVQSCKGFQALRDGFNIEAQSATNGAQRALARSKVDAGRARVVDLAAYRADTQEAARLQFETLSCSLPFPQTH